MRTVGLLVKIILNGLDAGVRKGRRELLSFAFKKIGLSARVPGLFPRRLYNLTRIMKI